MIQTEHQPLISPTVPSEHTSTFWEQLRGMGIDDAISTISHSLVNFAFRLIIAIAVFYVGRFLIRKIYKAVYNIMVRRKVDASLATFVLSLLRITLYFVLIIIAIGILGVETSSFIAIFASAGVAIGMALSGTLQNFAGGVLILLLKPYKVGDYIEVQGYAGTVKSIQLFNTIINTVDNKAIIVPNGVLSTSSINNYSLEDYRRVDWELSLAYGTDYEVASQYIIKMLMEDERVVKSSTQQKVDMPVALPQKVASAPFVGLKELGDNAIVLSIRAWTSTADYWSLFFDMNQRFYKELPMQGFSFPFPQLDVHLDSQR